ncbi:MAG: hypothetical protein V2J07_10860, partial [Anaerolineae bacterium]|nr:hypothetical protein [Anaerolineae bacterium]
EIKQNLQDRIPEDIQQLFQPEPVMEEEFITYPDSMDFPHRKVVPLNLGVCSDGLPVRIDLNDPELEPIVAISNEVHELQQWIEHILHGLTEQRQEGEIEIALLKRRSTNLHLVTKAAEEKGLIINVHEMNPRTEWQFLFELAQRAEQRFNQQESDAPPVLILIEDLTFLKFASPDLQLTFEWLLQYGHEVGIQTMAAITCEEGYSTGRWLRYFPTRLFGSVGLEDDYHFNYYDSIPPVPQKLRYAGTTFAVWNHTHWLFFLLKNPQETSPDQENNAL